MVFTQRCTVKILVRAAQRFDAHAPGIAEITIEVQFTDAQWLAENSD